MHLHLVEVNESICHGKLCGNDGICIKKKCDSIHRGEGKFVLGLEETTLMVQRNSTSAYSTLALRPEQFDEECIEFILSLCYSIDDWTSIVSKIEASLASSLSPMTKSEFSNLLEDVKDNIKFMKTPFKTSNLSRKIFRDKDDNRSIGTYNDMFDGI